MNLLEQFVLYRPGRPSQPGRSLVIVLAFFVVAFAFDRRYLVPDVAAANDGHALAALDMALTRVLCDTPSAFSLKHRAPMIVRDNPSVKGRSMRQLLIEQAGSLQAYCASINQPFVNNENSLMVAEIVLLRLNPTLSYVGIGRLLHWMRLIGLAFVAFVMLESGFSIWMAGAAFLGAVAQLNMLQEHITSVYPFLFVLVSVAAAAYAWGAPRLQKRGILVLLAVGLIAGLYSSFGVNLRTSYFPVYVVLFALFVALGEARAMRAGARTMGAAALRALAVTSMFVCGYWLFQYVFISRHIPANMTYNSTEHSVAHPLVLALAIPENDFSRREGIHWQDAVGGELATRAIPDAVYLGPRYDEALFKFYRQLWRSAPREMAAVYWLKAKTAGKQMLMILRQSRGLAGRIDQVILAPVDLLPNGVFLLTLYVILAIVGCVRAVTTGSQAMWLLALLSVAGVLLQIESAVIMSLYVPNYHNFLVFYVIFIALWGWQAIVNAVWRVTMPLSDR